MYATPNIILPLFGGILFDKIGTHNGILLFSLLMAAGQGLCMIAGYTLDFSLMQWGRILFGIGCESLYVGQAVMLAQWFINFELNFANGSSAFLPLIASSAGGAAFPSIFAKNKSFGDTLLIGFYLCCGSLICAILLLMLEI